MTRTKNNNGKNVTEDARKKVAAKKRWRSLGEGHGYGEDAMFKYIIHKPWVLARILIDYVEEFKGMSIEEVIACFETEGDGTSVKGRETEYTTPDGEKIVLDSVFDIRIPRPDGDVVVTVGIEGQMNPRPGYPLVNRALYYLSGMIWVQKGSEFTGKDYGAIKKTYSIWLILEPRSRDRNSVDTYQMKLTSTRGGSGHVPELADILNLILIYVGDYNDDLSESQAVASALFSNMGKEERRELIRNRFNIDIDDNDVERLDEMSTIHEDVYDHGYADGTDNGIKIGTENGIKIGTENGIKIGTENGIKIGTENGIKIGTEIGIKAMADIVMAAREPSDSVEQSMSRIPVPEKFRSEVEEEVRKRIS